MDQIIEIITNLFAQIAEWFQAFIQWIMSILPYNYIIDSNVIFLKKPSFGMAFFIRVCSYCIFFCIFTLNHTNTTIEFLLWTLVK